MRCSVLLLIVPVCAATSVAWSAEAIFVKGGESVDLGPVYWVTNCRSTLVGTPTAEVMEGPPELTVTMKPQSVQARKFNSAKPVQGAELTLSAAKEVKSRVQGKLYVRIKYPTKDGERQNGREIDYTLFPASAGTPAPQEANEVRPSCAYFFQPAGMRGGPRPVLAVERAILRS